MKDLCSIPRPFVRRATRSPLLAAVLGALVLSGCLPEADTPNPAVSPEHVSARESLPSSASATTAPTSPAAASSTAGTSTADTPTALTAAAASVLAGAGADAIRRVSSAAELPLKPHLAYAVRAYVVHEGFGLHILAGQGVSDWTILKTRELFGRMVGLLRNPADAARLAGHQIFIITDRDPDLRTITGASGGYPGHRNTGTARFTVINQDLICTRAVDTLMPHLPPVYREWETPVHEFGHAIEHALRLENQSDSVFRTNMVKYDPRNTREYFTTALQNRLDSPDFGPAPAWEQAYLDSVFKPDDGWRPDCLR